MQIGNLKIENPLVLAPMAGITDKATRIIAQEYGAGLVCSEMVSAQALLYNNERTFDLIDLKDEKGPISVQLFGSKPKVMKEAARIVESYGADLVDINMGCPVPKVVKHGEGSHLMLTEDLAAEIVSEMKSVLSIPLTVKIRKGWDAENVNAISFAQKMEASGADALAIHGRTRADFYNGEADWDIIREVKKNISIPLIANGDISSGQAAQKIYEHTNCDGIMIGRWALGNPWAFREVNHFLKTQENLARPDIAEIVSVLKRHAKLAVFYKGERVAIKEMRKHIGWYFKGLFNATLIRREITQASSLKELEALLDDYLNSYQGQEI